MFKILPALTATKQAINLGSDMMSQSVSDWRTKWDNEEALRTAKLQVHKAEVSDDISELVISFKNSRPTYSVDDITYVNDFLSAK